MSRNHKDNDIDAMAQAWRSAGAPTRLADQVRDASQRPRPSAARRSAPYLAGSLAAAALAVVVAGKFGAGPLAAAQTGLVSMHATTDTVGNPTTRTELWQDATHLVAKTTLGNDALPKRDAQASISFNGSSGGGGRTSTGFTPTGFDYQAYVRFAASQRQTLFLEGLPSRTKLPSVPTSGEEVKVKVSDSEAPAKIRVDASPDHVRTFLNEKEVTGHERENGLLFERIARDGGAQTMKVRRDNFKGAQDDRMKEIELKEEAAENWSTSADGLTFTSPDGRRFVFVVGPNKLPLSVERQQLEAGVWNTIARTKFEFNRPLPADVLAQAKTIKP